ALVVAPNPLLVLERLDLARRQTQLERGEVAVKPRRDRRRKAERKAQALDEPSDLGQLLFVPGHRLRLEAERQAALAQQLDPGHEPREGAGDLRKAVEGRLADGMAGDVDEKRRLALEPFDDALSEARAVGVKDDDEALLERVIVDIEKISAGEDL